MEPKKHHGIVILSTQLIKDGQDSMKPLFGSLDQLVHDNAVQCLIHAELYKDTSLLRRLLVDTLPLKGGFRRAGLINWIRYNSPCELTSDKNVNLSGVDERGNRRAFNIERAQAIPFWADTKNDEMVAKPVFRANFVSKMQAALREIDNAIANTKDGKPIDASKPFYDGVQADKVSGFAEQMKAQLGAFTASYADDTRDRHEAKVSIRKTLSGVSAEEARKIVDEILVVEPVIEAAKELMPEGA